MKLIYTPSGRAGEYANKGYAANLFNGCMHGCRYCYVPRIRRMKPEAFRRSMRPQVNVLERLRADLRGRKLDQPLFLCFSCDPYPPHPGLCAITRKAIEIVMESENAVNILTKGGLRATTDFDLLKQDKRNRIGATLTFLDLRMSRKWEPLAAPPRKRIDMLSAAQYAGIATWASMEPVIRPEQTISLILEAAPFVDLFKIGKWNHSTEAAGIDWKGFYEEARDLLDNLGCAYTIKQDLTMAAGCGAVSEGEGTA